MTGPDPTLGQTDWRRLDARMLLIHPIQTFVRFLPALLAIFIARAGSDSQDRWELYALPLIVAYGATRWFTTRYRVSDGQIELRRGLFNKQTTTARLDRVRTVDLTAQVHHRMLGLAKVEISTAGTRDRLVLDSLRLEEGRRLRAELLHRAGPQLADLAELPPPTGPAVDGVAPPTGEELLLRLDPAWIRYAPLTVTGLASAAAIVGFLTQGLQRYAQDNDVIQSSVDTVREFAWWLDVLIIVIFISALAVIAYVLTFWGFRLTRNRLGSLHTARGLLTTRETSIDHTRLRGIDVGEPLGLRLAGARRLKAVSTGLKDSGGASTDWLAPPAPAPVVTGLGTSLVQDQDAVLGPLRPHGAAARRRRLTRSVVPVVVLLGAALLAATAWEWFSITAVLVAVVLLLLGAVALGLDRYAGLGHAITPLHVVARQGSLDRHRVVLQRDGVIGWVIRQTFFQRRAGVVTLIATTAAGQQHYDIVDITPERAEEIITEVDPEVISQFA